MNKLIAGLVLGVITAPVIAGDVSALLAGRGVWLQSPKKATVQDVARLPDYHMARVHIMVTDPQEETPTACSDNRPSTQTAKTSHLVSLVQAATAAGLKSVATLYVYPRETEISKWVEPQDGVIRALVDAGVEAVEIDAESPWVKHPACGYTNHAAAMQDLVARIRALKPGITVGVTTHTGRFPDANIDLTPFDYLALQAYSKCDPKKQSSCYPFSGHRYSPGTMQTKAIQALAAYPKPAILGLAAYHQAWAGHVVGEAMQASLDATKAGIGSSPNLNGYSYWSSRWIWPSASAEGAFLKAKP